MIGRLIEKAYVYPDGFTLSSSNVVLGRVNLKIRNTEGYDYISEVNRINCTLTQEKADGSVITSAFSFGLSTREGKEPVLYTNDWPSGLSVDNTIQEFKDFIASDLSLIVA